jgi:hypothetical protein
MRYYEFIVEYNIGATKNRFNDKILDKLQIQNIIDLKPDIEAGRPMSKPTDYQHLALHIMGVRGLDFNGPGSPWESVDQELFDKHKNEIVEKLIAQFEDFDPTPNNQYVPYLLNWYVNSGEVGEYAFPDLEDARSTLKESLIMYYKLRERIPERYRDIGQYSSASDFMNDVQALQSQYGKKEELPTGDYKKIYESKFGTAYWPLDQEAACYLGQGTQWCTAATRSENYFDQYNDVGGLIIINLKEEVELQKWVDGDFNVGQLIYVTKVQAYVRPDSDVRYIWSAEEIRNQQDIEIEPYMLDPTYNGSNDLIKLWRDDEFQDAVMDVAEFYRPTDWGIE